MSRYNKKHFILTGSKLLHGTNQKTKKLNEFDLKDAYLEVDEKSKRRFKITSLKEKLALKAETPEDRKKWVQAINVITGSNNKESIKKAKETN